MKNLKYALVAVTMLTTSMAHASPQTISGFGFSITYDLAQLGSSWSASFTGESNRAVLDFSSNSAVSVDNHIDRFSFSVLAQPTIQVVNNFISTAPRDGTYFGVDVLAGHTYETTFARTMLGQQVASVTSSGINAFPSQPAVTTSYGSNSLSATISQPGGAVAINNTFNYLDSAGDTNTLATNASAETGLSIDVYSEVWTPAYLLPARQRCLSTDCMISALGQYTPTGYQIVFDYATGPVQVISLRDITPITTVPEPETYAMLLAGLGLMGTLAKRRRKQSQTA